MRIEKTNILLVLFVLLMLPGMGTKAQTIYPACVSVVSDGTISITLNESFTSVFTADNFNGPYSQVPPSEMTIVGQTITFDNNVALNGNTGVHWFYFDSPTFTDTISNIWFQLSKPAGEGLAHLEWNLPLGGGSAIDDAGLSFVIEWDYPGNSAWWELKKVPLSLNSNDYIFDYFVDICNDSLNFRIVLPLSNSTGQDCYFYSNVKGDNFEDITAPDGPEILWVSVDTASNHAMLKWNKPPQPDLTGFVIYDHLPSGSNPGIDTIWNETTTKYIDLSSDPDQFIYDYAIAAFDSCRKESDGFPNISEPTADDLIQHTIKTDILFQECAKELVLNWNKYDNWPSGVNRYEVYLRIDGGTFNLVETVDSSISSYPFPVESSDIEYCFLIKAIDNSGTRSSLSNIRCKNPDFTILPDSIYLSNVNTDFRNDNRVLLKLYVEGGPAVNMKGFNVEAKYPNRDDYTTIGFLPYTGQSVYQFEDEKASGFNGEIWYRVLNIDICGAPGDYSNKINNIHLTVTTDSENAVNTLLWNKAKGRAGEVIGYKLYRLQSSTGKIESVFYNTDEFQNYYEDDLGDAFESDGQYCYAVGLVERQGEIALIVDFSNMACGLIEPRVWVPNAFVIGGSSPDFKPVFAYADLSNYKMTIFNRKGKMLFTSSDVSKGWDGHYKNNPVQQGVYVYVIEFNDGSGKFFIEKGTVTVF